MIEKEEKRRRIKSWTGTGREEMRRRGRERKR